jgi:hypothetical protein
MIFMGCSPRKYYIDEARTRKEPKAQLWNTNHAKAGHFQLLWTIGAQMTDMDQVLTLKCCCNCGGVHFCAAASAPLLLFTLGLKAMGLKVTIMGSIQVID